MKLNFMTLVRPHGDDLLILRTDGDFDLNERNAVNRQFRSHYPSWTGLFLVLHKDQKIERMPEAMARDVYRMLKKRFEPTEATNEGTEGPGDGVRSSTHDSVG